MLGPIDLIIPNHPNVSHLQNLLFVFLIKERTQLKY